MQKFEKFFKNKLKENKILYFDTTKTDHFVDFVCIKEGIPTLIELKNYKKFSMAGWKNKNPFQFLIFDKSYCYDLVVCSEASHFKKVTVYNSHHQPKVMNVLDYVLQFDRS